MLLFQIQKHEGSFEDYLGKNMIPLKEAQKKILEIAKMKRCLLFGESHTNEKLNVFLSEILPELKKMGYNYLVAEIDKKHQNDFDDYFADRIDFQQLEAKCKVIGHYEYDAYLMKKCKENRIKIICSDSHNEGKIANKRSSDEEKYELINKSIPANSKFLVDYGSTHTCYITDPKAQLFSSYRKTLGQLFRNQYGEGVSSILFNNAGETPQEAFKDAYGINLPSSAFDEELTPLERIGAEGMFLTSPVGNQILERGYFPKLDIYFRDYDAIINIKKKGNLTEKELSLIVPKKIQ